MRLISAVLKLSTSLIISLSLCAPLYGESLQQWWQWHQGDNGLRAHQLSDSTFMIEARGGGNMLVNTGKDGVLLVDDHLRSISQALEAKIKELTGDPVSFIINTHWHGDHSQGNIHFGELGALILAHENARKRLQQPQYSSLRGTTSPAYPHSALPKMTFSHTLSLHINGEDIDVLYLGKGHTDGDAFVYFRTANILHTGDMFVRYGLPFIDIHNGGSFLGLITATYALLSIINDETRVIPGHGPVSNREDVIAFRDMLVTIRDQIQIGIEAGKSLEQLLAQNIAKDYPQFMIKEDRFIKDAYAEMTAKQGD